MKNDMMHIILQRIKAIMKSSKELGSHIIDFDEFLDLVKQAMNARKTKEDVQLLFDMLDPDKTGYISKENLIYISETAGISLSPYQIKKIIHNCTSNNKYLTFDEFLLIMTREEADAPLGEEKIKKF